MKQIRCILLALIFIFLLTACERPAPSGDIATPSANPEAIPREAYPAIQPTETAVPADTTSPTDTSGETTEGSAETQSGEGETTTEGTDTQSAEETTTDEPPALEDGVYVVRAGDTLGQIAFVYNVSVADLMAANNLTNPDRLDVGQRLTIPEAGFADSPDSETTPPADETEGEETVHIVQRGDNLYRIGLRYGFTVDELAEYNGITNVHSLEVGQEIKIPPSN